MTLSPTSLPLLCTSAVLVSRSPLTLPYALLQNFCAGRSLFLNTLPSESILPNLAQVFLHRLTQKTLLASQSVIFIPTFCNVSNLLSFFSLFFWSHLLCLISYMFSLSCFLSLFQLKYKLQEIKDICLPCLLLDFQCLQ